MPHVAKLNNFIHQSVTDRFFKETFEIDVIDSMEANKVTSLSTVPLKANYKRIITADYVRHIKNSHENDLFLLPMLCCLLKSCEQMRKSITRNKKTNKVDINIEYCFKLFSKEIQYVEFKNHADCLLEARTFFIKDI